MADSCASSALRCSSFFPFSACRRLSTVAPTSVVAGLWPRRRFWVFRARRGDSDSRDEGLGGYPWETGNGGYALGCYRNYNNTTGRKFIKHQSSRSSSGSMDRLENKPLVKMCGITSPEDAALACEAGADLIGMIIWPNSKRSVSLLVAKEITKVAKEYGAEAVGVFVDDDVPTILRALEAVGLDYMQLHGEVSRAGFPMLRQHGRIMYVLHAAENGELLNTVSLEESCLADWILVDGKTGGSGKGFNWSNFRLPDLSSKNGWLLAGGINTQNVCEAVAALKPNGVDVSSGICGHDGIRKDSNKIFSFMSKIRPTVQIS